MAAAAKNKPSLLPPEVRAGVMRAGRRMGGLLLVLVAGALASALMTYTPSDPSLNTATAPDAPVMNALGGLGAILSDLLLQSLGVAAVGVVLVPLFWGGRLLFAGRIDWVWLRALAAIAAVLLLAIAAASLGQPGGWHFKVGIGGFSGGLLLHRLAMLIGGGTIASGTEVLVALAALVLGSIALFWSSALKVAEVVVAFRGLSGLVGRAGSLGMRQYEGGQETRDVPNGGVKQTLEQMVSSLVAQLRRNRRRDEDAATVNEWRRPEREPQFSQGRGAEDATQGSALAGDADIDPPQFRPTDRLFDVARRAGQQGLEPQAWELEADEEGMTADRPPVVEPSRTVVAAPPPPSVPRSTPTMAQRRDDDGRQGRLLPDPSEAAGTIHLPPLDLLGKAKSPSGSSLDEEALMQNARLLEGVLSDFGVNGEIVQVRPGPVVTLYELEPAPGTKTSRVVGLADDIARSMSAVSVRIAVVPGKSTIGIELPNAKREMVNFRELLSADDFHRHAGGLVLALGRDIGGAPVYVDLSRMPHLLIAGTTGSGKSVAVNTMICSLLYKMTPQQCRFIMVDPKMLELSVYDGIPHLLTPVVTDPGKAVVALKWAVKEMENRYRAMSQMGVRNIAGYNQKLIDAAAKGKNLTRTVQTGFDPETGKPIFEEQQLDMTPLPFIVVIVDEMADLMLVAGKDVEAAIQRLAQMARAAGIHLVMATQRPSVDVITGTIKANFPTRVSFQVTSKIDSRTILGEQGAEQLLGQGDMLYMAAGGRITRVHGPFVSDAEVEAVAGFLRDQAEPDYIDAVTNEEEQGASTMLDMLTGGGDEEGGDGLFDQAVALVARERKASTSFIQRHLQIGYNRAARIIERMEKEGMVSRANHVGKREVLLPPGPEEY